MRNDFMGKFLEDLDTYVKENLNLITGTVLANLYFDFGMKLKELSGISANYEWLTEFIIFRFIYHSLGHDFQLIQDTQSKVVFKCGNFTLAPNKSFKDTANGRTQEPDIAFLANDILRFIISVKCKDIKVEEDFSRIKNLRHDVHSQFRSTTISFSLQSKSNQRRMSQITSEHNWHNYIILQGNSNLLLDELLARIGLSKYF